MRLFIAINFNTATRLKLVSLCDELSIKAKNGSFAAPENLHLTLVFLGECDALELSAAQTAISTVDFQPFPISINRIGRFLRDGGDIWWAGMEKSKALLDLQRELSEELIATGFSLDRRKYTPHITLGRKIRTNISPWLIEPFGEIVNKVELMKSERVGGKLVYTAIYNKEVIE